MIYMIDFESHSNPAHLDIHGDAERGIHLIGTAEAIIEGNLTFACLVRSQCPGASNLKLNIYGT